MADQEECVLLARYSKWHMALGRWHSLLRSAMALLAFAMVLSMPTQAATYYVTPGGSDSNSGTSPSAPWQNCPGMTAYSGPGSLKAGDVVYFDSGGTWLTTGA
jgi:hypothetical protein